MGNTFLLTVDGKQEDTMLYKKEALGTGVVAQWARALAVQT